MACADTHRLPPHPQLSHDAASPRHTNGIAPRLVYSQEKRQEIRTHFVYVQEESGILNSLCLHAGREWNLKLTLFTWRKRVEFKTHFVYVQEERGI